MGLSCFKKLTKTRSLEGIEFKDSIELFKQPEFLN